MSFDLVLRGGTLYDGSGQPGERGDLAIAEGRITAIGDVSGSAKREIDVSGLAVAPGFIDIKTHSDFTLPINPKAESKVRQGVTTEVIGHCGFSVAPVQDLHSGQGLRQPGVRSDAGKNEDDARLENL
jgi:N-acyl-D-amino-acid deacylase